MSLKSKTQAQKTAAFERAVAELKANIQAQLQAVAGAR